MMRKMVIMMAVVLLGSFVVPATAAAKEKKLIPPETGAVRVYNAKRKKMKKEEHKTYQKLLSAGKYFRAATYATDSGYKHEAEKAISEGFSTIKRHFKYGRIGAAKVLMIKARNNGFKPRTTVIGYIERLVTVDYMLAQKWLEENIEKVRDPWDRCLLEAQLKRKFKCTIKHDANGDIIGFDITVN